MPINEYKCKSCDYEFEMLQKASEVELLECPHCHRKSLRKQISLSTFRIYGEGVYKPNKR